MTLGEIIWPWGALVRARHDVHHLVDANKWLEKELNELRLQVAKFDGDGDGRIGGSRKKKA